MTKRTLSLTLIASCMNKRAEEILQLLQTLAGTDQGFIFLTFNELINWHLRKGDGHRMRKILSGMLDGVHGDYNKLPPKIVAKALQEIMEAYLDEHNLTEVQAFVACVPLSLGYAAAFHNVLDHIDVVQAMAALTKKPDHDQEQIYETVAAFEGKHHFAIELSPTAPMPEQIENILRWVEIGGSMKEIWKDRYALLLSADRSIQSSTKTATPVPFKMGSLATTATATA